ncbi:MAG: 6-carboxytetrahydropterin synthase [Candidatus Bathyarchaeota archaeon]|nr:6-carboxytetrahydropterin synthase [Candidatus Bathyarchaeota archaeon]
MYKISIIKKLIAQHYLLNEKGFESKIHSHPYKVEVILSGNKLDKNGYLVNFVEVEKIINDIIELFRDKILNKLEEFTEFNPSLENFARIFCQKFISQIKATYINSVVVKIWESEDAWALYQEDVQS